MTRPEFHLQRINVDGSRGPVEIYPVFDLPIDTKMKRRAFIGAGLSAGALLTQISAGQAHAVTETPGKIRAHTGPVEKLVISPNGKLLISAGGDQKIKVWSLPDGKLRGSDYSDGHIDDLVFAPDNKTFLSLSNRREIRLQTPDHLRAHTTLENASGGAESAVAYTTDGQILTSHGRQASISLRTLPVGKVQIQLNGHNAPVQHLVATPDGALLASAAADGEVRLWSMPEGTLRASFKAHGVGVQDMTVTPDSKLLATTSADKVIRFWSLPTGLCQPGLGHTAATPQLLAASPDGRLIASLCNDGVAQVWSLGKKRLQAKLQGHSFRVTSLVFIPGTKLIATGSMDRTIKLWPLPDSMFDEQAHAVDTAPVDSREFRTWWDRGGKHSTEAQFAGLEAGEVRLKKKNGRSISVPLAKLSDADQQWIKSLQNDDPQVTAYPGQSFRIWTGGSGKHKAEAKLLSCRGEKLQLQKPDGSRVDVRFDRLSPEDQQHVRQAAVAVADQARDASFADSELQATRTLDGHTCRVNVLASTPDGKLLASGDNCGVIALWDLSKPDVPRYLFDPAAVQGKASSYDVVDSVTGYTITYTLPCGSPIPAGAICTCNCVPGTYVSGPVVQRTPVPKSRPTTGGIGGCSCVPVCICMAVPICQAHRLLHDDRVVRRMASELMLVMGKRERAYMTWAAQRSQGRLRARIMQVVHAVERGVQPNVARWPTVSDCVDRLNDPDEVVAIMAAQLLALRQAVFRDDLVPEIIGRVQNLVAAAICRPWYARAT